VKPCREDSAEPWRARRSRVAAGRAGRSAAWRGEAPRPGATWPRPPAAPLSRRRPDGRVAWRRPLRDGFAVFVPRLRRGEASRAGALRARPLRGAL